MAKVQGKEFAGTEVTAFVVLPPCSFTTGFCFDLSFGRATY